MKINFTSITCRPSLKSEEVFGYDIAKDLGDAIYQNSTRFEDYELATRIFKSEGDVDVTEEEAQTILKYSASFPLWVQIGIVDAFNKALSSILTEEADPGVETYEAPSEMVFEEPAPESPAPDGGVYAGEGGEPAPDSYIPEEPIVEVHETVPQTEVVLEDSRSGKTTRKTKKK